MSDALLAPAITVLLLLALFAWVPALHGCQRLLRKLAARRIEFTADLSVSQERSAEAPFAQRQDTAA